MRFVRRSASRRAQLSTARRWRAPRILRVSSAFLLLAGCDAGGYRVVVDFEPPSLADDVTRIEVSLVASCDAQPFEGGEPVGELRSIAITRDGASGTIGSVAEGSYGLYARGRSATCAVVAGGCTQYQLVAGGEGDLSVTMTPVAGPGCDTGETCAAGACTPAGVDAGPRDAGGDGGAGRDGGRTDGGGSDGGCTEGASTCTGSTLSTCRGGTRISEDCVLGCADATRCTRVLPSNVDRSLLDETAADLVVSAAATWDTTACSAVPTMTLATQSDGSRLCVARVGAFTVAGSLTVTGLNPLVVLAERDAQITGSIDVSARGVQPGPGGGVGGANGVAAGGPRAGTPGLTADANEDGGGGGGGACGPGGPGGRGDSGMGGGGGTAATAAWELEPLTGGSGGAVGPDDGEIGTMFAGAGGGGGGAIQITSQRSILVGGAILAGGGGGGGGDVRGGDTGAAGGGGGSGGSILLEAPVVSFAGGHRANAAGGGGGGSAGNTSGSAGQDGADAIDRAIGGGAGGGAAAGGLGGGGTGLAAASGGDDLSIGGNGGGGGGGAGCILLRTARGTAPSDVSQLTPRAAPGLRTLDLRTY